MNFDEADRLLSQGRLTEAEPLYINALRADPRNFIANHRLALIRARQGRYAEALRWMDTALMIRADPALMVQRASVFSLLGRYEEALSDYGRVLALQPDNAEALFGRAGAFYGLQRLPEALADYDRTLALRPDLVEALNNRGNTLRRLGRAEEALEAYAQALNLRPQYPEALFNMGDVLREMGRHEEALQHYDSALNLQPNFAEALVHRGMALRALGRSAEALEDYDRALSFRPGYAEALYNRGNLLAELQRHNEALASYDQALVLAPDYVDALVNRAAILQRHKKLDAALGDYDWALTLKPDSAVALYNRAVLQWTEFRRYDAALGDLEKLVRIDPHFDYAQGERLHLRMFGADWRDFEKDVARIEAGIRAGNHIAKPFQFQAVSSSPADLKICAANFAQHLFPAMPALPGSRRHPRAKIRLGYLSGEFREQATAFLTAGLYEAHDHDGFELVAFDSGANDGSPMRKRLETAFDKFVPIADLSDRAAAETVQAHEIDILINLNGYFGQVRMGIFARRPAPLQVNYLGFPGTLGADYMDYILADRIVIPPADARHYSEKVVWLPDCYQANDSQRRIANVHPTRAQNNLPESAFVFANFNAGYKLTPKVFAAWMRILRQAENSVLWQLEGVAEFGDNLRREAAAHGVAPERLIFAPRMAQEEHLARLRLADLSLDTLPCNAHTTASDALWAGLPLITVMGRAFAGRVAASLLTAIGLPELIADNLEDYEKLAVKLARDPAALAAIRGKLSANRLTSPLFDTARHTRSLEQAYATMWNIHKSGEAPRAFSV